MLSLFLLFNYIPEYVEDDYCPCGRPQQARRFFRFAVPPPNCAAQRLLIHICLSPARTNTVVAFLVIVDGF